MFEIAYGGILIVVLLQLCAIVTNFSLIFAFLCRSDILNKNSSFKTKYLRAFLMATPGLFIIVHVIMNIRDYGIKFRPAEKKGSTWHKVWFEKMKLEEYKRLHDDCGNCIDIWKNM